jgi:hypothetical protein
MIIGFPTFLELLAQYGQGEDEAELEEVGGRRRRTHRRRTHRRRRTRRRRTRH